MRGRGGRVDCCAGGSLGGKRGEGKGIEGHGTMFEGGCEKRARVVDRWAEGTGGGFRLGFLDDRSPTEKGRDVCVRRGLIISLDYAYVCIQWYT